MRVIFWGTPSYALPSLEALIKANHEIICVVSQPDKRRSRGGSLTASPVKQRAKELGVKVISSNSIKRDKENIELLRKLNADIFVVVAFGQILSKEILDIPPLGCWNCHGSLLPRWRGAGPIQWSLLAGDKHTGVGVMYMEEGLDTGPILCEDKVNIELQDNYYTLSRKLSILSGDLIVEALHIIEQEAKTTISSIKNTLTLKSQETNTSDIIYARQLGKSDRLIKWDDTSFNIHKRIMALFPNAFTIYKDKILKIEESIPDYYFTETTLNKDKAYKPGEIVSIDKTKGIIISCKMSFILVSKGKIEGKQTANGPRLIQQLGCIVGDSL